MQLFEGRHKPKSCVIDCWFLKNQITDTCRALLLFLSLVLSTGGKILECSALMESLQGLLFRLLLRMITKRQNKFS